MDKEFRNIIERLPTAGDEERVSILQQISEKLSTASKSKLGNVFQSNSFLQATVEQSLLIQILASIMNECRHWAASLPQWVKNIILAVYCRMMWKIPPDQTKALVKVCVDYLSIRETSVVINLLCFISFPHSNKVLLSLDSAVESKITKALFSKTPENSTAALRFLHISSENCMEWQSKLLADSQLIRSLLTKLPPSDDVWTLFGNLSHHPDAKTLFPPEVLSQAQTTQYDSCIDICAILSSEQATKLTLDSAYVANRAQKLRDLLDTQTQTFASNKYTLLDLILPLVNLSVADDNKEILGKHFITSLLRVLEIKDSPALNSEISQCLERSQQEAAKTLWNLAFNKENCKLIEEANGQQKLNAICQQTLLQHNISGVLYMLDNHQKDISNHSQQRGGKHVMISYSWSHQTTVKRLADSLKDRGYRIWLDIEQMKGSTLEAMAGAIEQSELVLMCVSQKYKDSPNCRLEGEYCQSRQVGIIPLLMQHDYKADGWLGILVGSKLWYDFSNEDQWDDKINGLTAAIGNHGKGSTPALVKVPTATQLPKPQAGLLEWMKEEGIEKHHPVFQKHHIDNAALAEFKALLLASSPLVSSLFALLNISEAGEILKITAAIRKL